MSDYYDINAPDYFESTFRVDPSSFLHPLSSRLKRGSTVLDIGCGSGRDLLWLKSNGFEPTGFERSPNLAALARQHSGCTVIEEDFMRFDFSLQQFDALLLVGALVHIDHDRFSEIFGSISEALKNNGYALITLKEGTGYQKGDDGRVFFLWQQIQLEKIFRQLELTIVDLTIQVSKIRKTDVWLGYLLQKS